MNTRTLVSIAAATALLALASAANALSFESYADEASSAATAHVAKAALGESARVGVARVELGRLIPVPQPERYRWADMEARTGTALALVTPGGYLNVVPEIDFDGHDTDNKLDEMRLAALDEGFSHLLVYGVGEDARAGSFARRPLSRTGLALPPGGALYEGGEAKAVIVELRTGRVLAATTAEADAFGMAALSDAVAEMLDGL